MDETKIEVKPEKARGHKAVKLTADMLPSDIGQQEDRAPFELETAESKPIPVRIIRENGPTALVEWADMVKGQPVDWHRAYVPKEVIHGLLPGGTGSVEQPELDAGTPYGVRWEEFVTVTATPQQIGMELRRRGIWTTHDFEIRLVEAQSAFWAAYGADLGNMLQRIRKQEE